LSALVIFGVCAGVFVGAALGVVALTGRRRLQWIVALGATLLLVAAAVLSRFW